MATTLAERTMERAEALAKTPQGVMAELSLVLESRSDLPVRVDIERRSDNDDWIVTVSMYVPRRSPDEPAEMPRAWYVAFQVGHQILRLERDQSRLIAHILKLFDHAIDQLKDQMMKDGAWP